VSFGGNAETAVDFRVEAPIVFSSGNGNAQDIWIMNPDGTGLTMLTTNPGFDGEPALSPTARRSHTPRHPPGWAPATSG
jgi:hypothetical protein